MAITHSFVCAIADDATAAANGEVVPTNWNADHAVTNLVLTHGTITTDVNTLGATVTWNAAGVTFTAQKINVTDTASASGSLLADWQVGGVSLINITKTGALQIPTDAEHGGTFALSYAATSGYGTPGTLVGVTADTTVDTTSITLSVGHGLANGNYVTIGSMVGAFVLSGVGATSATLNRVATASLTGAVVQLEYRSDPEVVLGYNLNTVSEPTDSEWVQKMEVDYLNPSGYRLMEWYLQYQPPGGASFRRPIAAAVNADLDIVYGVTVNAGYSGFYVVNDDSSSKLAHFTDGQINFVGSLDVHKLTSGGFIQTWTDSDSAVAASIGSDGKGAFRKVTASGTCGFPSTSSSAIITLGEGNPSTNPLTGSQQFGMIFYHTATTAATSAIEGIRIDALAPTNSMTCASAVGLKINQVGAQGSSTVTRARGLWVTDYISGTNEAQIQVGNSTTFTGTWALYCDHTSPSHHAGRMLIGTTTDDSSTQLQVEAGLSIKTSSTGQSLGIKSLTELLTIAAAATSTTTIQKPANSLVLGVSVRVTTAVTCTSTFTVGDSGNATRFSTAAVSKAANSTDKGTAAGCYYNATAEGIVITPDTVPSDATGRVRVTIHYIEITPPTS